METLQEDPAVYIFLKDGEKNSFSNYLTIVRRAIAFVEEAYVYIYIRRKKKKKEGKVSHRRKILTDHRIEEQGTESKKQLGLLRNERKRFVNVVDLKDPIWNLSVKREACIVRSRLASSWSKSDGRKSKG